MATRLLDTVTRRAPGAARREPGAEHTVARYEDLVADTAERHRLGISLDWPLEGRPDRHLAGLFARQREVLLHDGKVTTLSLTRRRAGPPPELAKLEDWVRESQSDFQQRFGYS